jgi:hypothetical protein
MAAYILCPAAAQVFAVSHPKPLLAPVIKMIFFFMII